MRDFLKLYELCLPKPAVIVEYRAESQVNPALHPPVTAPLTTATKHTHPGLQDHVGKCVFYCSIGTSSD